MSPRCIRILFVSTAILLVAFIFSLDVVSFKQISADLKSRRWVEHSYKILLNLDEITRAYAKVTIGDSPTSSERESFADLVHRANQSMLQDNDEPAQAAKFERLKEAVDSKLDLVANQDMIWFLIRSLRSRQLECLEERRQIDDQKFFQARKSQIWSTIAAAALIVILFCLGWMDNRTRKRIERLLYGSLQSLMETNSELAVLSSRKSALLKSTVHDLKNPLGSISGFAEMIEEEANGNDSVLEMSKTVKRISKQSMELVATLLQESALAEGRVQFEKANVRLGDCVADAVTVLGPAAEAKVQSLVVDNKCLEAYVEGDEAKLRDVFLNLIGNAIKFSPLRSTIHVHCARRLNQIRVEIVDQGPGFTAEDEKKIFQPEASLSAKPTGGEKSNGLGLSIVKSTVERHQGVVYLDRRPNSIGACFVVELPLAPPIAQSMGSKSANHEVN